MAGAAAQFAGRYEAFVQARDLHTGRAILLREAVESLVGPDGGPPPPLSCMPGRFAVAHPEGITAGQVHRQAWRSHLAASVSKDAMGSVRAG